MKKLAVIAVLSAILLTSCSRLEDGDTLVDSKPEIPPITAESQIRDYITEIEIDADCFDEYFALTIVENPTDATGAPISTEKYDYYIITSRIFEEGMVFYDNYDTEITLSCGSETVRLKEFFTRFSCLKGEIPTLKSVKGVCMFAGKEDVSQYTVQDGLRLVVFCDGTVSQTEGRHIFAAHPY